MGDYLVDENIIINDEPYLIKVRYPKYDQIRSSHYYNCEIQSANDPAVSFKSYMLISIQTAIKYDKHNIINKNEVKINDFWKSEYKYPFLYGLKSWILHSLKYKVRWNSLQMLGFEKLPDDVKNGFFVCSDIEIERKSGFDKNYIERAIFSILENIVRYFEIMGLYGLFFSSEFTLEEIQQTLNIFNSRKIIKYDTLRNRVYSKYIDLQEGSKFYNMANSTQDKYKIKQYYSDFKIQYDEDSFVFVIMPFTTEKFEWLGDKEDGNSLKNFITQNAKAQCITLVDDYESDDRVAKMFNYIRYCKFAIAEISSLKPNVIYEVGLAHGMGKKVILVCSIPDLRKIHPEIEEEELFKKYLGDTFDINHNRINTFENNDDLKPKLAKAIEQTLKML